jgi:predicted RNA-binding Zn-ribbon protein involved in translation (DUF1610 family)
MTTPDRDTQMAALSLLMDEKELANLAAQHRQWERQQAILRGDSGSLIDPRSFDPAMPFTPVQCVTCGVKLTSQNHAHSLTCHECVAHEARIQFNAQQAAMFTEKAIAYRQAKKLAESKKAAKAVIFWVCVAIGGGMIVAWILNKAFFAAGQAL